VAGPGRIECHEQDVIAAEPQVDMLKVRQVPEKQSSAGHCAILL
jgi:hypothetical protein